MEGNIPEHFHYHTSNNLWIKERTTNPIKLFFIFIFDVSIVQINKIIINQRIFT